MFCYENKLVFPTYISDQKFKNLIDLLLVIDKNKLTDLFHKTKSKNKKYFCKSCVQCFSGKYVLTEH